MDAILALLPEDEKPGCLFQGLFLEGLPVEIRDHLVSREFNNSGLGVDSLDYCHLDSGHWTRDCGLWTLDTGLSGD